MRLANYVLGMFVTLTLLLGSGHAKAQTDFTSVKPNNEFFVTTSDGINLSTQEWGNPNGPTIIFVHGFLQSHLSWWKQLTDPALSKQFRMITFDLPGHGASDKPWDKSFYDNGAKWADAFKAVVDASGPQRPVAVGWSYGTRVIGDYLIKYGDAKLAGINFVGSAVNGDTKLFGSGLEVLGRTLSEDLAQNLKATREFDRICFAKPPSDADLDQLTAISMSVPIKVRQWARRPAPYEAALKAIHVPVLVTHGTEDQVCLLALAKYVVSTVPNAKASFYEGNGHSPFWEDPDRFNKELAQFATEATSK